MKLGMIFKKEFKEMYGDKIELFGDEITIERDGDMLVVSFKDKNTVGMRAFPVEAIQLIYLGEWNL